MRLTIEKRRPRSRIFLVFLWLLMLILSLLIISAVLSFLFGLSPQRLVSLDWGGYVATSSYSNPSPVMSGVSGSWTVPKVTVTPDDRFSAAWVGIGGQVDSTLIQVGTEHDSIGGLESYSAWYELLPDASINITTVQVRPGDKINASIVLVDAVADSWVINIMDVTTGQQYSQDFVYNSSRLSAEWIVERPTVNNGLAALADFGSITFTNAMAAKNDTAMAINKFSFAQIAMYDRRNNQLVSISSLGSDGESFTVSYLASGSIVSSFGYFENRIVEVLCLNGEELFGAVQGFEQNFAFFGGSVIGEFIFRAVDFRYESFFQ